jgi:hypothetical protein
MPQDRAPAGERRVSAGLDQIRFNGGLRIESAGSPVCPYQPEATVQAVVSRNGGYTFALNYSQQFQ